MRQNIAQSYLVCIFQDPRNASIIAMLYNFSCANKKESYKNNTIIGTFHCFLLITKLIPFTNSIISFTAASSV